MLAPSFSASDFQRAFQKLLPSGPVWSRDPDSLLAAVLGALAPTYERQVEACLNLLNDAPPFFLYERLPDWEQTLGLPDPCAGPDQTVEQRVAQVIAKLKFTGGQSAAYFIALAATLGYLNCTITNYAPFRVGIDRTGEPLNGQDWAFAWTIDAPSVAVTYFRTGVSTVGEPLYSLVGDELQCTIGRYAPAHTIPLYAGHT